MNYFELHLGDYAKATGHLSILEDGAYSRLLRKYYGDEAPLPADVKQTQRLVGARSAAERKAVEVVLKEFFVLKEDGWHNSRADEEIAAFHEEMADTDERRKGERARQDRVREQRSAIFEELAKHGIKPRWNATMKELRANLSRVTGRDNSAPVTRDITDPTRLFHSPVSTPQSPSSLPSVESKSARAQEHCGLTQQQVQQIRAAYPRGRYKPARWGDGEHCLQEHAARGIPFGVLLAGAERYAACWKAEGADERSVYGPQEFFSLSAPMFERPWAPSTGGKPRAPSPKFMTAEELEAQEAARATR